MNESNKAESLHFDFEDFFENTTVGYLVTEPDGSIIRANEQFCSWLGYSPEEIRGHAFSEYLSVGGRILEQTHLGPLLRLQGSVEEIALELVGKSKLRIPVLISAKERRSQDGEPVFIRYSIFKASARRTYEDNLRVAKSVAEGSLANERETSALREQFIAVLGHDLRNPLNAISLAAAILQRSKDESDRTQMVETINSSVSRMQLLINDIMDFARGQLGAGLTLELEEVDIKPILFHLMKELTVGGPDQQINLDIAVAGPIKCDPGRLSQMVSNIVANAVTHGAAKAPIQIKASLKDGFFTLSVANEGEPIPPNVLERLFEPFVRNQDRPSKQGLGLGLFIASQIARAHGGTLTASSVEGETCFTFVMPQHVAVEG